MSKMQISVILPVFNAERYLAEAIESALTQTYPPLEVIVVDDGSSDGSAALAQRYSQVRFLTQPHLGVSVARNRGVAAAQGDVLAFLDADDLWLPHKLACQVAALLENPALDMVFGHVDEFSSPEIAEQAEPALYHAKQGVAGLIPTTLLIRKSAFVQAGPFEPHWQVAQFFEWYARAREKGLRSHVVPEVIARRRLHGDNLGIRQQQQQSEYVQIAKALLDRRRRAGKGM